MEKHEIVIVGAGPAGLKAAEILDKAKKDVLVIEKDAEEEIRDKTCEEIWLQKAMKGPKED